MTRQNAEQTKATPATATSEAPRATSARKPFVEPAISQPVDVLEATTFFQVVDSGGTGLNRRRPGGDD